MNPHLGDSAADSRITPNRADGLARPLRCLTAALALGALFPAVASARTWYVYADGSGDAPFVQAAVDSAQDGDVILVGPGSYPEPHVGIRSKSLELASLDGPEVTRIRQLSLFEPPGDGVHSITVRGFTIQGGDAPSGGVFAANVGAAILENCVVKGFAYHSEISHVRTVVVSRCTFADNVGTEAHNYGGGALLVMPRSGGPLVQITECLSSETAHLTESPGGAGAAAELLRWHQAQEPGSR